MLRYDSFKVTTKSLKLDSSGFLNIPKAYPSRAGIFVYKDSSGKKVSELRHPDEVFRADSMESLAMKPFSIEHRGGILNPDTVQKEGAGTTGENIARENDFLTCSIAVFRSDAISQIIDDGVLELSAGYTCDIVEEGGLYKGQRYDRMQTNIKYNHLTLTRKARGEGCRIRLDSGDAILADSGEGAGKNNQDQGERVMKVVQLKIPAISIGEVKFDSETIEVEESKAKEVGDLIARLELVTTELGKNEAKLDSLAAEKKEFEAKLDSFNGYIAPSELGRVTKEHAQLLSVASEFKLDKADELSLKELKVGICKATKKFDEAKLDSSADYLDAAWDITKQGLKKPSKQDPQAVKAFSPSEKSGEDKYLDN
jgi:hypothetical protein